MITGLRGRDMITTQEWTIEELETVLEVAKRLKMDRALGVPHPTLRDKVLAMLFFFSSTRTRASFEAGMAQLGGHAQFIESKSTQIAHGDTAKEIGVILGRYNDGIAIRQVDWGLGNAYIRDVAERIATERFRRMRDASGNPSLRKKVFSLAMEMYRNGWIPSVFVGALARPYFQRRIEGVFE